jgi:hypothetical protein
MASMRPHWRKMACVRTRFLITRLLVGVAWGVGCPLGVDARQPAPGPRAGFLS